MRWLAGVLVAISGCNTLAGIGEPLDPVDGGLSDDSNDADAGNPIGEDAGNPVLDAGLDAMGEVVVDSVSDAPVDRGIIPPSSDAGLSTIEFQGSWFNSDQHVDHVDVLVPSSVRENDFMWVALYTDLRATSVTAPLGWMLRMDRQNSMNDFHTWWFYKIAAAGEPVQPRFTFTETTAMSVAIVVYSGVDTSTPFDRGTAFDTSGSPCVAPAIPVATSSDLLFVASFLHDTATKWMPLDTMNERAKYDRVYIADYPQPADGATSAKSVACTPEGQGAVFVMGLRPSRL